MDEAQQVDLVVIGLGPGGEALATATAKAGLRVVAVDKHLVGGECPYYGCIPTKMMVRAADLVAEAGRADQLSGDVTMASSWAPVAERVAGQATDHWDDRVAVERLGERRRHRPARRGPAGRSRAGRRAGAPTAARRRTSRRRGVVLNPGTRPSWPGVPGLEGTPFWTNRDAVQVTSCPARSSCSAAVRSGASWPGLRAVRRAGHDRPARRLGCSRPTSPRPPRWSRTSSSTRGSGC